MNKYLIICSLLFLSCRDNAKITQEATENVIEIATKISTNTTDTLCFLQTQGIKHQDTSIIKLVITNNDVVGKMLYMPHEKDGRFGNIKGNKNGDILDLVWTYMQEGMKDSIPVILKMNGSSLLQKSSSYDLNSGREFIADTAEFRKEYSKMDCILFSKYDFDKEM